MTDNVYWVKFDQLESFMRDVFIGIGVPSNDATVCADVLTTSDRYGIDSHGISRCKSIYYDRINIGIQQPVTEFEVVKETPTTALIDGHHGMGHVISKRSMQMAIDKAKEYGLGMVAVRNSTHYGIAGYYSLMAIENGMIGMTGTNARPSIAPTFGVENMLGTNPLTLGLPTDDPFPFLLDCATSVSQRGKIEVYARQGKKVPAGWVINREGKTSTDSVQILKDLVAGAAALVPVGGIGEETAGFKGYGYATFIEIMCAALQDGSYMKQLLGFDEDGNRVPYKLGHFFLAINIESFVPIETFKLIAGNITRSLRGSNKAPAAERIYTAWEKEYDNYNYRKDRGALINERAPAEIDTMREELKLTGYTFPWD